MKCFVRILLLCSMLFSPLWALAGSVDINSADAETLATAMKGVGAKKAVAIVAERDKNGPFKSIDDLTRVKGISAKTVEANRDKIMAGDGKSSKPQ